MSSGIRLQSVGHLAWYGIVTAEDAASVSRQGAMLLENTNNSEVRLDVHELESANSLVAALLLGWWRIVTTKGHLLKVQGASPSLCSVLDVYGLGWMLDSAQSTA